MKNNYIALIIAVFGVMCAIFGFYAEISNVTVLIPATFYLQMSIASFLAAIFFQGWKK